MTEPEMPVKMAVEIVCTQALKRAAQIEEDESSDDDLIKFAAGMIRLAVNVVMQDNGIDIP